MGVRCTGGHSRFRQIQVALSCVYRRVKLINTTVLILPLLNLQTEYCCKLVTTSEFKVLMWDLGRIWTQV